MNSLTDQLNAAQATITDLRKAIADLERALDGAIWVRPSDVDVIADAFSLSNGEAGVVMALANAKIVLPSMSIDQLVSTPKSSNRLDGEFRSITTIRIWVMTIRRKLGRDFILSTSGPGGGYFMPPEGKARVTQALAA